VHVGCSGWFYWHWRDDFYPVGLPTKDWFRHYSKQFGTVELNATFYSWPTVAAVRVWLRQIGRRKFTVKASEVITHVKRFAGTKTLIRDFGHIADLLGARMGCFLFQLPPGFHYTPARLKRIVSQLDPARRNVVEFRHISTSVFMGPSNGIVTTTLLLSWRRGLPEFAPAERSVFGRISITTVTVTRSKTPANCGDNFH
jgi:uncharacterized protein YecE (DUF72 family)